MTKLVIANFKMNGSKDFIESWIQDFFLEQESANDVVVALPSPYLIIFNDRGLTLSGQNVSNEESGAFTSQLSAQMLKDCGAKYCLIGHSEARQFLKEKNEVIKQKFDQLIQESIKPILCIGEPLQIKEAAKTIDYLSEQLDLIDSDEEDVIVAYEPIWSIGTGLMPEIEDIQMAVDSIRSKFHKTVKVLYGGSVNSSNAQSITDKTDIDGLLVGGASLNPKEFGKIAQLC
ncbi:MAG: triose-phosphate isomerase [Gammaproteobacteria bacterium TMED112]|nr:MAG: triose-phosphate isomerase [Gammaproteobacteria bacterium TMED112]|tara:strand:- start:71 stop:763 length:693 start_codon:yes stop_codon:yes gene_type:complete